MVHVAPVTEGFLPFRIELRSGEPISDQVVYAVEKAVVSGLLKPGARFPSVRGISQELRIHPNTTQKAISALVEAGFLEVQPGIGTIVAANVPSINRSAETIAREAERLVLQARRMRLELADLQRVVEREWRKLTND